MHLDWAEAVEKAIRPPPPLFRKLIDHPSLPDQLKQRAYLLFGQSWHQQRHYAEALKILEESIARFPSAEAYPERWYLLGSLYAENPGSTPRPRGPETFCPGSQEPAKTARRMSGSVTSISAKERCPKPVRLSNRPSNSTAGRPPPFWLKKSFNAGCFWNPKPRDPTRRIHPVKRIPSGRKCMNRGQASRHWIKRSAT